MLYHISAISGIQVLVPKISSHGKPYVYAIDNFVTGLLFGAKCDDFDFILTQTADGIPEVYECYPNAFRRVYQGKTCSVYELKDDGFLRGVTSWSPELVCEQEVPVQKEHTIENLYEKLLEEISRGRLILHPYQDQPEYKRNIAQHIVDRLIRFDLVDSAQTDARFQQYYKGLLAGLRSVMDGHLL